MSILFNHGLGMLNCNDLPKEDIELQQRYKRNLQDDLKNGFDLLFKFKDDLDKLHPDVKMHIHRLLN